MLPQNICSRVLRILPFDPSNMAVVVADGRGADVGFPRLPPPVARDDWKSVRFLVATFITFWSLVIFRERFCFATSIYFFFCGHMDFNNEPVHGWNWGHGKVPWSKEQVDSRHSFGHGTWPSSFLKTYWFLVFLTFVKISSDYYKFWGAIIWVFGALSQGSHCAIHVGQHPPARQKSHCDPQLNGWSTCASVGRPRWPNTPYVQGRMIPKRS